MKRTILGIIGFILFLSFFNLMSCSNANRYHLEESLRAAGDNAIESQDSRYWGLLPEKFIVGTVIINQKNMKSKVGQNN